MKAEIRITEERKLVGKRLRMSFTENKTKELWQSFMPLRNNIKNRTNPLYYSLEVYDTPEYFTNFNPANEFYKWAAVEVNHYEDLPDGMKTLIIPSGFYAVFIHKGSAADTVKTYTEIFTGWLPASQFDLDHRPHFAVMDEKYKNDHPDSEEEIWIPVKQKIEIQ